MSVTSTDNKPWSCEEFETHRDVQHGLEIVLEHFCTWEQAQQCHVLLYPKGMVTLNPSSAEILKHCDGSQDAASIINKLQQQYPEADLAADVEEFLAVAVDQGWIRNT